MVLKSSRDVADDLQRGQAVWSTFPEGVRTAIWGGIWSGGMYVAGRMSQLQPVYLYAASACTFALGALVYARIQESKRSRANIQEPKDKTDVEDSGNQPKNSTTAMADLAGIDFVRRSIPSEVSPEQLVSEAQRRLTRDAVLGILAQPNLNVRVFLAANGQGGTPGIHIKAENKGAETIESAALIVTNILRWNPDVNKYVTSRDIHDSGVVFPEVQLNKATLHPGEPETFQFIHGGNERVDFAGKTIRTAGKWEISYRLSAPDGRSAAGQVYFEWVGGSAAPVPSNVMAAFPFVATPTKADWERMHTAFRKYDFEVDALWNIDASGCTVWSLDPFENRGRNYERFRSDAAAAGQLARRAGFQLVRAQLPASAGDDDFWLSVLASRIEDRTKWMQGGNGEFFDKVIDASKIVCRQFGNEAKS